MLQFHLYICLIPIFVLLSNGLEQPFISVQHSSFMRNVLDFQTRQKRGSTDQDVCATACASKMNTNIDENVPELKTLSEQMSQNPVSVITIPKDQFINFCKKVIKPAAQCLTACDPSTLMTKLLTDTMTPSKYLCIDHYDEISDSYDCLQDNLNVTRDECYNGKCKAFNQAPRLAAQQSKDLVEKKDFDGLKKLMGDTCDYTSCMSACSTPIVAKACNESIANVMGNDFLVATMKSFKEMTTLMNPNPQSSTPIWPDQCEKILTSTATTITTPTITTTNTNANGGNKDNGNDIVLVNSTSTTTTTNTNGKKDNGNGTSSVNTTRRNSGNKLVDTRSLVFISLLIVLLLKL